MNETSDEELWRDMCAADDAYYDARMRLLTKAGDLAGVIGTALTKPSERGAALRVLQIVPELQVRRHLPLLARLASMGHSDIVLVRSVIARIDHDWLIQHIDAEIRPLLDTGTEEEFRRIAELYKALDPTLLEAHLLRCKTHADEEVREVASDFASEPIGET